MMRTFSIALALVFALAPRAQAQVRGNLTRSGGSLAPETHPAPAPPAGSHDGTAQKSGALQPAGARPGDQQCLHGQCSDVLQGNLQHNGAMVIPARSSTDLVQQNGGGAIPATSVITSGSGPSNALLPGPPPAQLPMPRQPLSDVLDHRSVRITIRAISAAHAGAQLEIDGRLAPIDRDLRSFADQFSFRSYRLLDVQTFDLDFRSIAQMELPGQRAIEVEPRQLAPDGRVQIHLELLGQHPEHAPRMRTDYSIPRGRTILVGGYRIDPNAPDGGTLLLAITQDQ